MEAIRIEGLNKRFGEKAAVNDLTFTVNEGELVSLLGVNGAGKTTTIRMACGLLPPDSGDAVLLGHSIVHDTEAAKGQLNVSPQETAVAPNLTVRENLELMARIYGADKGTAQQRATEVIAQFKLGEKEKKRAKTLSGGQQRRLSIAMALISQPKILFLDEPTLGLDVLARRELWQHIRALHGKMTIVLTTHYMEEAEALSDHVYVMCDGHLTAQGTVEELKASTGKGSLEEAFIDLVTKEGAAV